jgi:hypothetical protein
LKRESWGQLTGDFDLDHFVSQSFAPNRALDYANLLYACHRCNLVKGSLQVVDPLENLTRETVTSKFDGTLSANNRETKRLILQLDLNSPALRSWRQLWFRINDLAEQHNDNLLRQ